MRGDAKKSGLKNAGDARQKHPRLEKEYAAGCQPAITGGVQSDIK